MAGADLSFANMARADLTGANLMNCECEGTKFEGTKLDQALFDPEVRIRVGGSAKPYSTQSCDRSMAT